jgi:hypothetical protein
LFGENRREMARVFGTIQIHTPEQVREWATRGGVGGENFRSVSRLGRERVLATRESATRKEKEKPPRARVWGEGEDVAMQTTREAVAMWATREAVAMWATREAVVASTTAPSCAWSEGGCWLQGKVSAAIKRGKGTPTRSHLGRGWAGDDGEHRRRGKSNGCPHVLAFARVRVGESKATGEGVW